uniref:Uncharacterized protein n=1 Tax=Melopsittacus undulatus TaxID=13146 RepID=A0A8V5FGR2_MELUD
MQGTSSLPKSLLGLSIATLSTVTHYGPHFTLIRDISLESNSYRVIHHTGIVLNTSQWCFQMGIFFPHALTDGIFPLHPQGFFCFALAFCGLATVPVFCVYRSLLSLQVEESMMDVYDLVYEEVRRNASSFRRHELTAIHKAVYGMILTSFLWFSIHFSSNLDRKGKYILRESFWHRKMSEVTHRIPWEGFTRVQAVGCVSCISPSCTTSCCAFLSWSGQMVL